MILNRKDRQRPMPHSFYGLIVEVDVGQFQVRVLNGVHVHAKPVVLRGYFNLTGEQIFDWVIRPVVPEFELEGFSTERQAQQLMAEANAERGVVTHEASDRIHRIHDRFRIPRAIG